MNLRTLRTILDDIAEAANPDSEVIVMTSSGEDVAIRSVLPVHGDITKIYIRCRSSL